MGLAGAELAPAKLILPLEAMDTPPPIMGNGDMHLTNWSLIYRGAGDRPALAPVYDVLSTISLYPD
jgi:hypothetical protein